uniref:SAM domain-containing protein n=2 Tax=Mesocestoides corti TaxID=53468 RepID=A0A5K3FQS3_MESCO
MAVQVLDLSTNRIKEIPDLIGNLTSLQSLNFEDNCLQSLPANIGNLRKLRTLRLDRNPITKLPVQLGHLRHLNTLTLPAASLTFPPKDVCVAGVSSVLSYLRKAGKLPEDDSEVIETVVATEANQNVFSEMDRYWRDMETKRRQNTELHHRVAEEWRAQDELARHATESRSSALKRLAQEETRTRAELDRLQKQRDQRRQELVASLCDAEAHADALIARLRQRDAAQAAHLLQEAQWEEDQMRALYRHAGERLSRENREKVINSMQAMLLASEKTLKHSRNSKKGSRLNADAKSEDADRALRRVLANRQADHAVLAAQVAVEETRQKEAFECFQQQRDLRRQRIVGDIRLVEEELRRLTRAEQERRRFEGASAAACFAERRSDLVRLLAELQKQKELRESELRSRLVELEERKARDETDYWLVQYQRLMEKKPPRLLKEAFVDDDVYQVLAAADASDYAANFEYHRITSDRLLSFTDNDLIRIGVHALGAREAILRVLEKYKAKQNVSLPEPSAPVDEEVSEEVYSAKSLGADMDEKAGVSSTAAGDLPQPSAPPARIVARFESECCVCQDAECSTIFLPCGHVCCCEVCSARVSTCPLCRRIVEQCVQLS